MPRTKTFEYLSNSFNYILSGWKVNNIYCLILTNSRFYIAFTPYHTLFDSNCKKITHNARGLGIEPRFTVPETVVLPLDDPRTLCAINFYHYTLNFLLFYNCSTKLPRHFICLVLWRTRGFIWHRWCL